VRRRRARAWYYCFDGSAAEGGAIFRFYGESWSLVLVALLSALARFSRSARAAAAAPRARNAFFFFSTHGRLDADPIITQPITTITIMDHPSLGRCRGGGGLQGAGLARRTQQQQPSPSPSLFRHHLRDRGRRARFIGPGAPEHRRQEQQQQLDPLLRPSNGRAEDGDAANPSTPPPPTTTGRATTTTASTRPSILSLATTLASDPRAQLVASVVFIALYVASTYSPPAPWSWRALLDLALSALFAYEAAKRVAASPSPLHRALLQPSNLLDLLSSAPALLEPVFAGTLGGASASLRWLRVFRALRLLRLVMLSANLPRMRTSRGALLWGAYNVPLLSLVASVAALAATGAALVAAVERLPLHDSLYFVLSSISTIGFGDITAKTTAGRAVVLALMVVALVLVPPRVQQLAAHLSATPVAAGPLPTGRRPFVVLSASRLSDVRGFEDLLAGVSAMARREAARAGRRREKKRRDDGDKKDGEEEPPAPAALSALSAERDPHVVALTAHKPAPEFLALQEIAESRGRRLTLLQGSVFSAEDLQRAALERAEAVVIASDRFATRSRGGAAGRGGDGPSAALLLHAAAPGNDADDDDDGEAEEDVEVLFRTWAVKSFTESTPLRVQVLREGAARRVAPFLDPRRDVVVSVEQTRHRLLALGALCPGASTLVANLLRPATDDAEGVSEGEDDEEGDDGGTRKKTSWWPFAADSSSCSSSPRGRRAFAGRRWLREYADGCRADVQPLFAGAHLAGATFAEAAEAVATATAGRVVLLGLVDARRQRVRLNPSAASDSAAAAFGGDDDGTAAATTTAGPASSFSARLREGDELLCACRGGDRLAEDAVEGGGANGQRATTRAVARALELRRERAAAVAAALLAAEREDGGASSSSSSAAEPPATALRPLPPPSPTTRSEQAAALEELVQRGHPCLRGWAAPDASLASVDGGAGAAGVASLRRQRLAGANSSDDDDAAAASAGEEAEECSVEAMQELAEEVRAIVGRQRRAAQQQQQQQRLVSSSSSSLPLATPPPPPPPAAARHIILCGHADSFLPFSRQLVRTLPRPAAGASSSSPLVSLRLVLLHPDATAEGAAALERALRVALASEAAAAAAETARRQKRLQMMMRRRRRRDGDSDDHDDDEDDHAAREAAAAAAIAAAAAVAAAGGGGGADLPPSPSSPSLSLPVAVTVRAVAGRPMDKAALEAAGARKEGAALVFVGPRDRGGAASPSSASGADGAESSSSSSEAAGYGSLSRAAVQADADALLTAYGVGEPRSAAGRRRWESMLLSWLPGAASRAAAAAAAEGGGGGGASSIVRPLSPPAPSEVPLPESLHAVVELSFTSSVRLLQPGLLLHGGPSAQGFGGGAPKAAAAPPSSASGPSRQPRASWRDRRAVEEDARAEGLAEWQVAAYYAGGRACVPAAVDTLVTVQPLYRAFRLPALLEALAGDDGGGGGGGSGGSTSRGSPLAQVRVPAGFVGRTYGELAQAMLLFGEAALFSSAGAAGGAGGEAPCLVPLGLLRPKVESPSWRLPYVSALPDADAVLDARDAVFYLRPRA
jgi:hypothetical protein